MHQEHYSETQLLLLDKVLEVIRGATMRLTVSVRIALPKYMYAPFILHELKMRGFHARQVESQTLEAIIIIRLI
jgi:hypothetical protein